MMGIPDDSELKGIMPRMFSSAFDLIAKTGVYMEFDIKASMFQIYHEEVQDLLNKDILKKLEIRESQISGVYVKGLTEMSAKSEEKLLQIMNLGKRNQLCGSTAMGMDHSHIHLLFMLSVTSKNIETEVERKSKLFLVDLAGSENNKIKINGKYSNL